MGYTEGGFTREISKSPLRASTRGPEVTSPITLAMWLCVGFTAYLRSATGNPPKRSKIRGFPVEIDPPLTGNSESGVQCFSSFEVLQGLMKQGN